MLKNLQKFKLRESRNRKSSMTSRKINLLATLMDVPGDLSYSLSLEVTNPRLTLTKALFIKPRLRRENHVRMNVLYSKSPRKCSWSKTLASCLKKIDTISGYLKLSLPIISKI
jgi:hypothetical protein